MHSNLPKVLHKLGGIPMIDYIIDSISKLSKECVIVIGDDMQSLKQHVQAKQSDIKFALQKERLGTADAVKLGISCLEDSNQDVLVVYGDTPLINLETIKRMQEALKEDHAHTALVLLSFTTNAPGRRGRCVLDEFGCLQRIVEHLDCSPDEKNIATCNQGTMLINKLHRDALLAAVSNNNASREFYLTDLVALAIESGLKCKLVFEEQEVSWITINSKADLAEAECTLQDMLREKFLDAGVTLIDPSSVYFAWDTIIEHDVTIEPNVFIGQGVKIYEGAHIKSFSHLEGAQVGRNSVIGPFARLRPNTAIGKEVRIGNFVEIKNSTVADESRISHLSYVGDATVGRAVNIGAGTITCNYDGTRKHKTEIKDRAFVGSNAALVAPVSVGKGALVSAGSVITHDVEDNALAIARSKQKNITGGAKKFINQTKAKK